MELGATMELLGEEVSQLWGRRPLYIVGGTNQPLPPFCPEESGSTAVPAVLPLATISGTTAGTRESTQLGANSGTTALERYYRSRAVLPLVAPKRYYRSGPRYYRWDQRGHTERGERAHQRSGKARRVCKGSVRDDSALAFPKRTPS